MQRKRIQYVSSAGVLHRTPLHRIQGPHGRISKITLARAASTSTAAATPFLRKCARLRVDSLALHQEHDSPPSTSMASQDGQANVIDLCGSDSDHGAKSRPVPKRTQEMIDLTSDSERNKSRPRMHMRINGAPNGDRNGANVPSTGGSVRIGPSRREGDGNSSLFTRKIGEQVTNRLSRPKAEPSTLGRASASDRYGTAVRSPDHRHKSRDMIGLKRPRENDPSSSALGNPAKKLRLPNGGVAPFSRRLGSGSGRPGNSNGQISGMIDLTTEDDGPAASTKTAISANSASTNIQRNAKGTLSIRQPASSDMRREFLGIGSSSGFKSKLPVVFEKPVPVQSSAGSESSRNRDLPSLSRTRTSKAPEQPLQIPNAPTRKSPTVRAHEQSSQGPGLEVPESPPGTEVLPKTLDSNHTSQKASLPDEGRIGSKSRQKSTTPAPPLSKSPRKASPSREVLPKALDSTQAFQRGSLPDSARIRAESRQRSTPPTPHRDNSPKQASPSREMKGKDVGSSASKRGYPISPSETSIEDSAQPQNREAEKEELHLAHPNASRHGQDSSTLGRQSSSVAITHLPQTSSKIPQAIEPSDAITTSPVRAQSGQETAQDGLRVNNDSIGEDRQQEEDSESEDETRPNKSVDYVSKCFGPQSSAKLVPVIQSHPGLPRAQDSFQRAESSSAITAQGSDPGELTQHAQTAPTPTKTTAKRPRAPKSPGMSDNRHVRLVITKYLDEMRNDNEHFVRTWLREARHAPPEPGLVQGNGEPTSVFKNMRPLNLQQKTAAQMSKKKKPPTGFAKVSIEKLIIGGAKPVSRTHWVVPYRNFELSGEDVPNYSHYVSIKDNFLAHNEVILQHWPYFGDEFDIGKSEGVRDQYWLDIALRREKLDKMSRAERYAEYCEEMLRDIGLEWSDILHFLLDSSPDVENDPKAQRAVTQRKSLHEEDLVTSHEPWTTVVKDLPEPEPEWTRKAAFFCDHFKVLAGLHIWHVARRSDAVAKLLERAEAAPNTDELTCRLCMRFSCPYHGEIRESEDGQALAQPNDNMVEVAAATDIIHPTEVNFRTRVGFPPSIDDRPVASGGGSKQSLRYWQTGPNAALVANNKPDSRGPFYPCYHPGLSCSSAVCSCFEAKVPCEKQCACSSDCHRRFRGCNCSKDKMKRGRKRVCFGSEDCACYQLGRECDADLCGDCGVCDVLDPVHRHDDEILHNHCANANIQRGVPKHTVLGDSGVHGLGLYACEEIRENDFVAEYKGELVTKNEAERRGAVYEHQKLSYLFSLNNEQEIDSTYFGNKVRFINHAVSKKANLFARTIMCNSVHRIALYGSRLIKPGEELFFDYGPMFPSTQLGGADIKNTTQPQTKSAPHVRNSLLVSEFHDLEEVEEHGLRRARKSEKFNKSTPRSQVRVQTASSKRAGKSTRRPKGGKKAQANEGVEMQEAGANDDEDENRGAKSAKNVQTDEDVETQEVGTNDDQDEDYEVTGIINDASEYRPEDDGNASERDEQEREEDEGKDYIDAAERVRPARTRSRTRTRRNELQWELI